MGNYQRPPPQRRYYTVQLIDEQEHLVSLTKADLREYTVLKSTSMPSYKDKFSARNWLILRRTCFPCEV